MNITIVTAVTNKKQYQHFVFKNRYLQNCMLRFYDNSQENLPIPTRYNHFIENELSENTWTIFCHQDFEFLQNPEEILKDLDPNYVYGPIGVETQIHSSLHLIFHSWRIKPSFHKKKEYLSVFQGQIHQYGGKKPFLLGRYLSRPANVDTLDCCCVIVHSSLLKKHNLRFDSTFDFHLYAEDFCLSAHLKGIKSRAVQIQCAHHSLGNMNKHFWNKYQDLLRKFPHDFFLTTCVSNPSIALKLRLEKYPEIIENLTLSQNLFSFKKK